MHDMIDAVSMYCGGRTPGVQRRTIRAMRKMVRFTAAGHTFASRLFLGLLSTFTVLEKIVKEAIATLRRRRQSLHLLLNPMNRYELNRSFRRLLQLDGLHNPLPRPKPNNTFWNTGLLDDDRNGLKAGFVHPGHNVDEKKERGEKKRKGGNLL